MTRVIIICAAPTQWDVEGRLSGSHALPLTQTGIESFRQWLETSPPIDAVYCARAYEACAQVATMIAQRWALRVRDQADLNEPALGLWQGLRPEDLRQRFPSVFPKWQESPESVIPPEGEALADVIARVRDALRSTLRRNRGKTVALAMRPMSMQIAIGIVRGEADAQLAMHLHNPATIETIELDDSLIKGL